MRSHGPLPPAPVSGPPARRRARRACATLLAAGALGWLGCGGEPESQPPSAGSPLAAPAETLAAEVDPVYLQEIEAWRAERLERLTAEDGWLTLTGLYWLEKPVSTLGSAAGSDVPLPRSAPERVGRLIKQGPAVMLELARGVEVEIEPETAAAAVSGAPSGARSLVLVNDLDGEPTTVHVGSVSFHLIRRGDDVGVRVRDREHPARRGFPGIESYPVDPAWSLVARFEPYEPPRQIPIANVLGMVEPTPSPGALVFEHQGETYRLDALDADDELFVIFADPTNGRGTYGAGRYLYAAKPGAGATTRLDFNKAYNPPCAFTEFATCPLPPPQNRLPLAVTAGELDFAHAKPVAPAAEEPAGG